LANYTSSSPYAKYHSPSPWASCGDFRLGNAPQINENFVGRESELRQLQIPMPLARRPKHQNMVVLHGMGGVGKTQLSKQQAGSKCQVQNPDTFLPSGGFEDRVLDLHQVAQRIRRTNYHYGVCMSAVFDMRSQISIISLLWIDVLCVDSSSGPRKKFLHQLYPTYSAPFEDNEKVVTTSFIEYPSPSFFMWRHRARIRAQWHHPTG
jgi:hypothetical protein